MMSDPLVSVLMSVRNGERFLRDAVESILFQSLRELELIVINDGSTDTTAEILDKYQREDARVRVFHQENLGLSDSLNKGAGFARGTYLARMDADDIALRNRLALQVSVLEKHHELAVLGSAIVVINASGMKVETRYFPSKDDEIRSILLRGTCPICHPSVVMRTRAFFIAGGYRKAFVDAEDYDLWLRISDKFQLANLRTVTLKYRRHQEQVSVRNFRQQSLSALASRTAALTRMSGKLDPTETDRVYDNTVDILTALGVSKDKQDAAVVRGYLTCIRSMSDAGEATAVYDMIKEMLGSPEWEDCDLSLAADFLLLLALIHWRERRYLRSSVTAARAIMRRPAILGRPLKALLRLIVSVRRKIESSERLC